jgi:hypothetical protein
MEVDAKFREVVGLADLVRPKPRPWRRAGRRFSQKPGLKLALKGASKSAVADFDQPTARRMHLTRPSPRPSCGLSAKMKLNSQ